MWYSFRKVLLLMKHHKLIYFLLILEMAVGMCMYVYSCNLSISIQKKEKSLQKEREEYLLRIISKQDDNESAPPLYFKDYEMIQLLAGEQAELVVDVPNIMVNAGEIIDYDLLLLDLKKYGMEEQSMYVGDNILVNFDTGNMMFDPQQFSIEKNKAILHTRENESAVFDIKKLPPVLQNKTFSFISTDHEVLLSDCIVLPLTFIDMIYMTLKPEIITYELKMHEGKNSDIRGVLEKITKKLNREHQEFYAYEFYSPLGELRNNTYKTKLDIHSIEKIGILLLCTLFIASISIFENLLENRKQEIGICQTCGAGITNIAVEIFEEILLVCLLGTLIGCVVSTLLTYNLTSFLAGGIEMKAHPQAFFRSFLICFFIVVAVFGITMKKIYGKSIIELIRT